MVLLACFFVTNLELLQSFGIFFLQNAEVDLYNDILELAIFWLKNRGLTYTQVRLIHWKIWLAIFAPSSSITEVTRIANEFNTYFANIGNKLANEIPSAYVSPSSYLIPFPKQSVFFSFLLAPQRLRKKSLT